MQVGPKVAFLIGGFVGDESRWAVRKQNLQKNLIDAFGGVEQHVVLNHPLPEQKSKIWCTTRTTFLINRQYMKNSSK